MEKMTPKMIRVSLKMNQEEMAEALKLSRQSYNGKENGKSEFSFFEAKKMCEMANISMDAFDV